MSDNLDKLVVVPSSGDSAVCQDTEQTHPENIPMDDNQQNIEGSNTDPDKSQILSAVKVEGQVDDGGGINSGQDNKLHDSGQDMVFDTSSVAHPKAGYSVFHQVGTGLWPNLGFLDRSDVIHEHDLQHNPIGHSYLPHELCQ